MRVRELKAKRLVLVAGKGGVGKTTCSAAIALHLAAAGRRTLLVTVDPAKRLEDSLGVPVGFTETRVKTPDKNLTALMLDPESVIREHMEREIPQAKITEHPLFRYVTSAMPGLNELMAIGKLNDLRKEGKYDVIVVDTAPTGHALSFLGVPKAMKELMSNTSLLRFAMKGYAVWQKLSRAGDRAQRFLKGSKAVPKKDKRDIDFEKVFGDIRGEAERVQAFLTDREHSALVLVTIPEKLPVEETLDLRDAVEKLGMTVHSVVVNKVQPDVLGGEKELFERLSQEPLRAAFVRSAAKAGSVSPKLLEALVASTEFSQVRRAMNLAHIEDLRRRMPGMPLVMVPLAKHDVQGLDRLGDFSRELFGAAR